MNRLTAAIALVIVDLLMPRVASGQWLRDEPVRLFDGRVRIAADLSATVGARDDETFFNYTDYERNALRTLRLGATALWEPVNRVGLLAQLRVQDASDVELSAAYLRVRPFERLPLDVQAGRIPPIFGAFARRSYEGDRALIGYPLAYQYLTSLRPDALPADANDLLRMRGRGWRSSFPIGSADASPGLPLISALRWDTGIQANWTHSYLDAAVAVTQGTLSHPRVHDDNDGRQLSARAGVRMGPAFAFGLSGARGRWISDQVPVDATRGVQNAVGFDGEYAAGHLLIRGEAIWNRWRVPFRIRPVEGDVLRAFSSWIEARWRVTPRVYLAGRADHLGFSPITGTLFPQPVGWDAAVRRVEFGGGYLLQRNLVVRVSVQANRRDTNRFGERTFVSSQVAWWF